MLVFIAATPALRPTSFATTRRQVLVGGGLAVSTVALPAAAAPAWDLIGAYNQGGMLISYGTVLSYSQDSPLRKQKLTGLP